MDVEHSPPKYRTSDRNSFAYSSFRELLPAIITGAVDDAHHTVVNLPKGASKRHEGEQIMLSLSALKSTYYATVALHCYLKTAMMT